MASENEETPQRRSVARHARPRLTVRRRMQAPVGRAIAITAMPTALLMGTLAPKLAFADTKAPQATTVADTTSTGETCTKGTDSASATPSSSSSAAASALVKAAKIPQQQAKSVAGTASKAASAAASGAASAAAAATTSAKAAAPKQAQPSASASATPTATPSPSASASSSSKATDPIGGLLDGLGSLLGLGHADTSSSSNDVRAADSTPSAAASASPSPSASASASSASASPSASPSDSPSASASASPSSSAPAASSSATANSPSPSASSTDLNKPCDISGMAAPVDPNADAVFPADSWVLHASTLKLTNSIFHGVVTVHTRGGDKRVLKFTATAVDIGDLDMSTNQRGQKLHVQGAPGSTSTMRSGTVTMYVEKLSGKLEAAEGLPLGILNVNLTLTPDTLPQWLYNLVGSVPIPLNLTLSGVEVDQAGQQGGTLTIPGMHLYYTTS